MGLGRVTCGQPVLLSLQMTHLVETPPPSPPPSPFPTGHPIRWFLPPPQHYGIGFCAAIPKGKEGGGGGLIYLLLISLACHSKCSRLM